ncbi:kinase-like protein [Zopfia rhizophila CBS 207.26]|uniref:Kinase-like protein n=1 Tax=Zopfia rhizophila CBS 207.26 TaxID=1314779 RepID=A0A6A6EHK9_9PEZI|nr:kinase-like protein [Zopfia rhizophila CBS 207.26]
MQNRSCRAIARNVKRIAELLETISIQLIILNKITGDENSSTNRRRTAFSLFALLAFVEHPLLIIGFLDKEKNDDFLEASPELFSKENLKTYTGKYAATNPRAFAHFAFSFSESMPKFAVRHMDSGKFANYNAKTILPFINEREIRKMDADGHWTAEGANGKVFEFEIYEEYRQFPHARKVKKFARKKVEAPEFAAYLEKANLQDVQNLEDDHIVKLLKAYRIGDTMNLIFPLAKTSFDHLLRDPSYDYGKSRGGPLESCDAWKQLLGIAKALGKIAGVPGEILTTTRGANISQFIGYHFDLKPANILMNDDGKWVITDFGQAIFEYSSDRTPRVANQGGTDAYAPPEIDKVDEKFSRRYDVWSLGCIILEVAAFVVLGYEGLNGNKQYYGLDEVRREKMAWSRRQDERFFYQLERHTECIVKRKVVEFMAALQTHIKDRSPRSKEFLDKILHLVERMLEPNVEERIDIGEVIRILESTITQSEDMGDEPVQMVAAPGEFVVGGPELSSLQIWHWNAVKKGWLSSSLQVFEDLYSHLRFHCLANNKIPTHFYLRRQTVQMLPFYAFWRQERPKASEAWIYFSDIDPKGVPQIPGTIYSFSRPNDARILQAKLTNQNIEASFELISVKVKRFVSVGSKVIKSGQSLRLEAGKGPK